MARSKVNLRRNAVSAWTKEAASRSNEALVENGSSIEVFGRILVAAKRARKRAFAAHGLDERSPEHKGVLFYMMALELYGGRRAGRPKGNRSETIAIDKAIADEVDRLKQEFGWSRLKCCKYMKSMRPAYANYGSVETLRRRDRRGRRHRARALGQGLGS